MYATHERRSVGMQPRWTDAHKIVTVILLPHSFHNFFAVKLYGLQDNDPCVIHTQYHKTFQEMLQEY